MNPSNKSVAVVILNYNGRHFLEQFLPSVVASTYSNFKVYVADNGSTDDSVLFLQTHYPEVFLMKFSQNHGFAGGYNLALKTVESDYFVLLNSDVWVEAGWIEPVIAVLERESEWAAAQPNIRSFHAPERFEHAGAAGGYLDLYGFPFCRGRIFQETEKDDGQYDQNQEIFWASGAAFFIKSEAWHRAGGFDEDFFAHMEEIDLCWRLKRLGYKIGVVMDSRVYHVGGGTLPAGNPRKTFLNFRNSLMMLQKNLPFFLAVAVISARLWIDLFALIHLVWIGKKADAREVSRAHRHFFSQFFKTAAKRKVNGAPFFRKAVGLYSGSIVWDHYFRKITKFSRLKIR